VKIAYSNIQSYIIKLIQFCAQTLIWYIRYCQHQIKNVNKFDIFKSFIFLSVIILIGYLLNFNFYSLTGFLSIEHRYPLVVSVYLPLNIEILKSQSVKNRLFKI
jgi:hypothetical protein